MSRPLANWTTLWRAIDWLGEATTIKPERVKPILSLSLFHSDQKCVEGEPYTSPEVSPTPNIHLVLFGRRVIDTTKWEQGLGVFSFAKKERFEASLRFCMRWAVFWLTYRAPLDELQDAHEGTRLDAS